MSKESTIEPMFLNVLLERVDQKKSAGGIHLPEGLGLPTIKCEVVAAAMEVEKSIRQGQMVLIKRDAGQEVQHGDKKYILVEQKEILAKVFEG